MIEIERLRFPTGVAVATILKAPGAGMTKAMYLAGGFLFAVSVTLATNHNVGAWLGRVDAAGNGMPFIPETLTIGAWLQSGLGIGDASGAALALMGTALSLSLANIGAGLLSGRGGLPFALGGIMAWWFVGPFAVSRGWAGAGASGDALVGTVYGTMLRPTGIGILIGGALAGVVAAFPAIKGALHSLSAASKLARETGQSPEELPPKVLVGGLSGAFVALLVVALLSSDNILIGFVVAIVGTAWLGLAGLIVAQATGATDISPLSGLALIAVTLMLAITAGNVVLAVTIGVAVCIATNQCADMMTDLKTGHLVGSVPRQQQIVQFAVAWIGPAIAIGTTVLFWSAGEGGTKGFGPESQACVQRLPGCLPAPQAGVLQGMIEGVLSGNAPVDKYVAGALIGGGLALFPIGGLGVLVGLAMYLPFEITLGYGLGCVITMSLERFKGIRFIGDVVVPVAAGLIVGEALTALGLTGIQLLLGGAGGH